MKVAKEFAEGESESKVTFIRVNPEFPLSEHDLGDNITFIPLMEGALEAILLISAHITSL